MKLRSLTTGGLGFQQLLAAVGLGEVGVVLGLETSRLARSSSDWHRLLQMCGLTNALILDEDGLYNPGHFNDRLLLGLKGTMNEAELHVLRARLIGGIHAKASRGELEVKLPVGLVYDASGKVVLDPDVQVQAAVRTLFETFRRTGSATSIVRCFRELALLFPRRLSTGPHTRASWRGVRCSTIGRCASSRTRAMPGPSPMAAATHGERLTEPSSVSNCRASSGTRQLATRTAAV